MQKKINNLVSNMHLRVEKGTIKQSMPTMPLALRPVVYYAENNMNDERLVKVKMPEDVVNDQFIWVGKEEIIQFATMVEISVTCISLYIK